MNQESIRIAKALRTTTAGEEEMDEDLHQLVHDLQSCLQVIGLGVELLRDARDDDAAFAEIADKIDRERREAVRLLDEYLRSTRREK